MDRSRPKCSASANPTQVSGIGEFNQLALWMAASLAGMLTAMMLARRAFFQRLAGKAGCGVSSSRAPSAQRSLPMLAGAIVGSPRGMIQSVLGPPRTAAFGEVGLLVHPHDLCRHSDTWYYPLSRHRAMAMAIHFAHDTATRVEFFRAPRAKLPGS